jgi:F-type H+-transporting ATPase subunit delta
MNPEYAPLARKYAAAFLNAAGDSFAEKDFLAIQQLADFLVANRPIVFFLNLALIKKQTVEQVLTKLFASCATTLLLQRLVNLLLQHHRVFLLPEVLHQIADLYKRDKGIVQFVVTTAHEIETSQLQKAVQFLKRSVGDKVMYTYAVDPTLIAGLRMQSDTLLWEHSVKRQLQSAWQVLHGS